jgi:hypothetical protein
MVAGSSRVNGLSWLDFIRSDPHIRIYCVCTVLVCWSVIRRDGESFIDSPSGASADYSGWQTGIPTTVVKCDSQDLTLHVVMSDGVAAVRQTLW